MRRRTTFERAKDRSAILASAYVRTAEIGRLLDISEPKAKKVFDAASAVEIESGTWRPSDRVVRLTTVLTVCGLDYETLKKQIEG